MNSNLKALQWEYDDINSGKDGIDDGEDDFKQLVQELNKEERLDELIQQTLANILETVWHNPQSYEKIKDKNGTKKFGQLIHIHIGQKTFASGKFKQLF